MYAYHGHYIVYIYNIVRSILYADSTGTGGGVRVSRTTRREPGCAAENANKTVRIKTENWR
jgi:hypothetical protein